ncbi:MAG: type II toxin-antitoxin system RelE/ParE family toxin [Acidobacteriia bacterium]|nr:type II toxin-antitoxin system RelE/ParE family toxin [Terriglobia bacterium]
MIRKTRPVSWIRAKKGDRHLFSSNIQISMRTGVCPLFSTALTIAAEGAKADIAKPMHGLGSGVFEIALPFHGDAFRVVYAVQLADEIWVVHAFQKKSTQA